MKQKTILYLSFIFFVCALSWGIYTILYYLGMPVHGAVLLESSEASRLSEFCNPNSFVCRGLFGFFPFISHTLTRMGPFLWFGIASVVFYGVFLIFTVKGPYKRISFYLAPWHVYATFLLALTIIFTVIAFGTTKTTVNSNTVMVPVRRIVEPLPSVYRGAAPEALAVLQKNFKQLNDSNCLLENGKFSNDASKYLIKTKCIYGSFITRVLSQFAFISFLILEFLATGSLLIYLFKKILLLIGKSSDSFSITFPSLLVESVVSASLGACTWIVILWTLAVIGIYTSTVGWIALAAVLAISYKQLLYWLRAFVFSKVHIDKPYYAISIIIFWILLSYLAFNFLNVVRPFPIGWDDLGSYLNRPRLLVSYGEFVFSMATFQWEYISSLGFLLFGHGSPFGATASMEINWLAGALAVAVVFLFTNTFLGKGYGLMSALLYYSMPLIGHFSFADMKIDNAVFAIGAMSMFCMFLFLFPKGQEGETWRPKWHWLILSGVFSGFAFGIKQTAIMVAMTNGAILLGVLLNWIAFLGVVIASLGIYIFRGILDVKDIFDRIPNLNLSFSPDQFAIAFMVIAISLIGISLFVSRNRFSLFVKSILLFMAVTAIPVAPWLLHNKAMHGWDNIGGIEFGAPNTVTPKFDIGGLLDEENNNVGGGVISLPEELAVNISSPICQPTGKVEELDRYWGSNKGFKHYLTLPWRSVNNMDSAGYYVTTHPGLLMFPLLLLLPFFWIKKSSWLRWLFLGTIFLLIQWMFLANGIPWYGIGVFLGLCVGLEALVAKSPDFPSRMIMGLFALIWILIMFNNRLWQFDMQRNIFEYSIGKVDAQTMMERTIPFYDDISDIVVERNETMVNRPYLYRIGTFIPYFIPRNLEIIGIVDHQLDTFNCLYQERDPALTLKRLKALGFNSIIFDTNTDTIERDPNGSLHKKVSDFVKFVQSPESGLKVVIDNKAAGVAFFIIP
ncbi:hypothetical protein HOD24_00545 [Candidatus Peregrinibacteria bacterium]|jgi:hypothetical protein|nr:hypothetical protein [Candidatus Peregrinibacteria bacterium]MBT7929289.1 hypothetical protein [Candidatus Peregrinibacteria bacterium]